MIRKCGGPDVEDIFDIINDAAQAYKGVIPEDTWHEPYMSLEDLVLEIEDGVVFWGVEQNDQLTGVMGIQDRGEVSLIRHAYTRTIHRSSGIGSRLLRFLEQTTEKTILVGTWADANWAILFYRKNGFKLTSEKRKNQLLRRYWHISERQIEASVVLEKRAGQNRNTSS
ncbi:MAG: GNAT family N-acetyltransferase [Gammaproteobacteria bacterium]